MSRKTLLIILIIVVILVIGLVFGKKAGWFGKDGNIREVEISKIEKIDIIETVSATGKIQPEVEVKLSSEVSGEIIELPVKEGQQVNKGDLLVRINPDIIQSGLNRSQAALENVRAGLQQAEASLKEAKLSYERNKGLFDKGVISKADWDRAVSAFEVAEASKQSAFYNVRSAQASVNEAKDNLNRTTIYAPMSGTISKLSVELGERVVGTQQMAGTEIMRVANLSNMEVEVDVNENDIVKISLGDSTIVEVDAYLKKEFKGLVTEIANSAENTLSADQVTNFRVKVRILEESYQDLVKDKPQNYSPFRPGMTATVDVITNKRVDVVGIPISAIVIKSDTSSTVKRSYTKEKLKESDEKFECVYIKDGGVARLRVVKSGIQDDSNIEITQGLAEGEEVITGPYNIVTKTLKTGDKITTKTPKKTEE
ncbi:efflux RND transporter periplasmic adaptor subunit [Aquimarina sp. 2201CG14-23]|uniref:efflux RND transporter periplasmic adaptor subunit n=1 Tax=Aquimarina mycalae TaxID=3040073 RepID=UPI0024780EC5|nr:efflux RND transporter periplasmic adaptor subunit [Aquimarina sp. 2201CG14-23]MDH7445350.1 efflux RND transporter periplasmic adaptor subunit [Aquimarina sp. 2201CG14-23]